MKANDLTQDLLARAARRRRLAQAMPGAVALVPTAPERLRNRDTHYPYRYDSYFHYLTGFEEPESVLVLVADAEPRSILFCRERHPEREIWDGHRHGPERARERFGFDEARPIEALDEAMPALLGDRAALWYPVGADAQWDERVMRWLNAVRANARSGVAAPQQLHDVRAPLDDMRLVKDAQELAAMRKAGAISAVAHQRAMRAARPGRNEYEIEAELLLRVPAPGRAVSRLLADRRRRRQRLRAALRVQRRAARRRRAAADRRRLRAGRLRRGHHAHLPGERRATAAAQREVYELVLAAQRAAMDKVRAGNAWNEPHDAAVQGARAGHARPEAARGEPRCGAGEGSLQALLHAPHRALARHGRARCGRLQARRRTGARWRRA